MNKNLSVKYDFLYVLVDMGNSGVVCATPSANAAKAVALGCQRLKIHPVETHQPWLEKEIRDAEFNNLEKNYSLTFKNGRILTDLDPKLVVPEFTKLRKDTILRMGFQEALNSLCSISMTSLSDSEFHVEYASSINDELSKCSITDNVYTDTICAYAQATDCEPRTAVEELTVHMDNLAHTRLRTLGIYIKYRNLLNDTPATRAELRKVYEQVRGDLFINASV